ncbi:MAG: aminoglycoside phosphotransferase family protein [Chloroflexota bacterium]
MSHSSELHVDDGVRRRLALRFGDEIESWFDELPLVVAALAERWHLEVGSNIPRGSVSVVLRCSVGDVPVVLKVSPDHARLAREAAALDTWQTVHAPSVLALDERVGALLIEAIEPGSALVDSPVYPPMERIAELVTALHATGVPDPSFPSLADRVAYLYDSGAKLYHQNPALAEIVPPEAYDRGRQLSIRLAEQRSRTVLLHGDFTPSNILDGGETRRLVAIDPAPCRGDPAFDAVDLLFWQAEDTNVVAARVDLLAPAIGVEPDRMLGWCTAFAAMTALDIAASPHGSRARILSFLALAADAGIDH